MKAQGLEHGAGDGERRRVEAGAGERHRQRRGTHGLGRRRSGVEGRRGGILPAERTIGDVVLARSELDAARARGAGGRRRHRQREHLEHFADRRDAEHRLAAEGPAGGQCADQLPVDVDGRAAHALGDPGANRTLARGTGEDQVSARLASGEDAQDLGIELFDALALEDRADRGFLARLDLVGSEGGHGRPRGQNHRERRGDGNQGHAQHMLHRPATIAAGRRAANHGARPLNGPR